MYSLGFKFQIHIRSGHQKNKFILLNIDHFNNKFFFVIESLKHETTTIRSRRSGTIFLLFNVKTNDAEYDKITRNETRLKKITIYAHVIRKRNL